MPATTRRRMPASYFELVRRFPLVRLADDVHLADALATVDDLLSLELDAGGETYLDALSALIHVYEVEHHPIPDATPAEVLRELADANGLTGAALAQRSGIVPSTVSALMSGKRRPTPEQMTALAAVFNVSPAVFLPAAEPVRREKTPAATSSRQPLGRRAKARREEGTDEL